MKMLVAGYAALRQVDRWTTSTIGHAAFGLRYVAGIAARLDAGIERAEAVRQS